MPKKLEPIEGSETSAISNQTPGKHPKENILHVKHGESLKSKIWKVVQKGATSASFSPLSTS
jgi:hypothetical protein